MFSIGEVIVCVIVALLVLKPAELIKMATVLGNAVGQLKKRWAEFQQTFSVSSPSQPINRDHDE